MKIYVNVRQALCSFAPVFSLEKLEPVLVRIFVALEVQNGILDFRIDLKKVD